MRKTAIENLCDAVAELKHQYGGRINIVVGVHGSDAYDSVDYPLSSRNGVSWRTKQVTKNIRINVFAPDLNPYETAPDEWLSLTHTWYYPHWEIERSTKVGG